jgi:hypothetical protein
MAAALARHTGPGAPAWLITVGPSSPLTDGEVASPAVQLAMDQGGLDTVTTL